MPAGARAPSPWEPGTEFSKYRIDSRLAAGGMAEVWRAKIKGAQGFEKRIVIKTMLTSLQGRPELVQMFVAEAAVAAQLAHSNIVHVFDFGQLEGRYFIAMEYVPGVTLRIAHKRMVARGERLPIATVLHVMMDVCDALEHVHAAADARGSLGLVHRDISPDNVIISTSGSAKLIDFGAARATARTPPTPVFVGKYRYAAPERIRRAGEDRRSDVYSAGVILYECLTGKRPFDGTDAEVIAAALASQGCDPRGRAPGLPARLADVVIKATAPAPDDRFASARELRQALAACLEEVGGAGKERDVTAALAELLEAPAALERTLSFAPASEAEAVPEPIGVAGTDDDAQTSSDGDIALCEIGILDVSGPIRKLAEPPQPQPPLPRPPAAMPPAARPPAASLSAAGLIFSARHRPRRNARRASAPSSCSIAAWRCAAPAATGRPWTRGRRRSRSHPTTASTRPTCSGCAAISAGCAPRRPPSSATSIALCASLALGIVEASIVDESTCVWPCGPVSAARASRALASRCATTSAGSSAARSRPSSSGRRASAKPPASAAAGRSLPLRRRIYLDRDRARLARRRFCPAA